MVVPDYLRVNGDVVVIDAFVVPRSSRNRVAGRHGARLKIQIAAGPAGGRANQALVGFVAEVVGVPKSQVAVVSGHGSRNKRIAVSGAHLSRIREALGA
jgi:uncharacterized protein